MKWYREKDDKVSKVELQNQVHYKYKTLHAIHSDQVTYMSIHLHGVYIT